MKLPSITLEPVPGMNIPLPPKRLIDTRETGQRVVAGGTLTVDLSLLAPGTVGPDAAAFLEGMR